jgi:hypothetical protein
MFGEENLVLLSVVVSAAVTVAVVAVHVVLNFVAVIDVPEKYTF